MKLRSYIEKRCQSRFFSTNAKTGVSVDFRICPMMRKTKTGYSSRFCPSCYSARLLRTYKELREKLESMPPQTDETLLTFLRECEILKTEYGVERIRFYGFGDFHPSDLPYIIAAAMHFRVTVISKILTFACNEDYLASLAQIPNLTVSLSFNKNNWPRIMPITQRVMQDRLYNVGFNYTMNCHQENPLDEKFKDIGVFHFTNRNKLSAARMHDLPLSRACCVYDEFGNLVERHGSCAKCGNCDHVFLRGE